MTTDAPKLSAAEHARLRAVSHPCGLLARPDRLAQLGVEALAPTEGIEIVIRRSFRR